MGAHLIGPAAGAGVGFGVGFGLAPGLPTGAGFTAAGLPAAPGFAAPARLAISAVNDVPSSQSPREICPPLLIYS